MTEPETIEAEPVEVVDEEDNSVELVPLGQVSIYRSMDPTEQLAEAQARAAVLVQVIQAQGLSKRFGNSQKPHVFVEGWQFLASQFGLIPDIEWTRELDGGAGWEARATLVRLFDGQVISHGEAECRNDEPNWKNRPSYAVRSMAQTRAVSKVCRISLSSVMVMAGMSATPAEEMDGVVFESTRTVRSGAKARKPVQDEPDTVTLDEPHCPACLDELGILVGVWENDKKPFWKCKAKEECAAWDGQYAWSGWRSDWANSAAEYRGGVVKDDPKTATIDTTGRTQRSGYIVNQIMELAGLTSRVDAEVLVKPGLIWALAEGHIDGHAALGGKPSDGTTDEELRVIVANLTLAEAEAVIAAAVELIPPDVGDA